ncbi:uncharacterized protein LTR77_008640 [Saxophila tyrrhenica]|uniref:Uncharacterized protein n=1 Tax=Saxophila tyrrhenica TaxID=1690608 RepID=A0AAV9P0M5_9PEZI|nr:hypothetical protein LTR77_008640 [Saxophila tyrrhenica]
MALPVVVSVYRLDLEPSKVARSSANVGGISDFSEKRNRGLREYEGEDERAPKRSKWDDGVVTVRDAGLAAQSSAAKLDQEAEERLQEAEAKLKDAEAKTNGIETKLAEAEKEVHRLKSQLHESHFSASEVEAELHVHKLYIIRLEGELRDQRQCRRNSGGDNEICDCRRGAA